MSSVRQAFGSSPAFAFIKQRLDDDFRRLEHNQVTPWAFFNADGVHLNDFDGRPIAIAGVEFSGSTREIFWGNYIMLFFKDISAKAFEETREFCKKEAIDREQPLRETASVLKGKCSYILDRMSGIDRRLRGRGFPKSVERFDPQRQRVQAFKIVDDLLEAELFLLPKQKPWPTRIYENYQWGVWLVGTILTIIGIIVGIIAL